MRGKRVNDETSQTMNYGSLKKIYCYFIYFL